MATSRRKPWESLAPSTRRRYERAGITAEQHAAGASLHRARGHISREHEQYQRKVSNYIEHMSQSYPGIDSADVRDAVNRIPRERMSEIIDWQKQAEIGYENASDYDHGFPYEDTDYEYPEWMHYYHGVFS